VAFSWLFCFPAVISWASFFHYLCECVWLSFQSYKNKDDNSYDNYWLVLSDSFNICKLEDLHVVIKCQHTVFSFSSVSWLPGNQEFSYLTPPYRWRVLPDPAILSDSVCPIPCLAQRLKSCFDPLSEKLNLDLVSSAKQETEWTHRAGMIDPPGNS
jgi:hypothetical protein